MGNTAADVIQEFELFMDDTTELSSAEELRLLDKIYQRVSGLMPWERLKKNYQSSGSVTSTTDSLPTRFRQLTENDNYTENGEYAAGPVVYVGSSLSPWKVINWSDRRNYNGKKGYAYVDIANSNMVFNQAPGDIVEYDYIEQPAQITATTDTFWIPIQHLPILYHGMCVDDFVIQQSEKARSYRDEHLANYNMYLNDLKTDNYRLVQLT